MLSKLSRGASMDIIAAVYVLAGAAAVLLYRALPYPMWLSLLIADVAATVIVFVFSVIFRNASVYDPYWSVQPIVIVMAFLYGRPITLVRGLIVAVICLWGIRLTVNWAYTFRGMTHEDWRYVMLREKTGVFYPLVNFWGIHMVPTLVVYGCVLPAVYVMTANSQGNIGFFICMILSTVAVILQGTADLQMHRFRREGAGGFIRTGLWKNSRHPNYLGEIIMWWGVALAAVSVLGWKWYLVAGAAANTLLFLCVSIPLADGRQSKKDGFEEYRSQTRMLLPIKR